MLAANAVVENVRSVLVLDDAPLSEREIVIPGTHRKNGSEAVPNTSEARLEATRTRVRLLVVGELSAGLAAIPTVKDGLLLILILESCNVRLMVHLELSDIAAVKNDLFFLMIQWRWSELRNLAHLEIF